MNWRQLTPPHGCDAVFYMTKKYIIGIDPGFTGAVAVYNPTAREIVAVEDMPIKRSSPLIGQGKANIDVSALASLILGYGSQSSLCVVERVSAAPGQGVSSMFRFGEGFGMIQGIIAAAGVRALMPPPSVWKASMNLSSDKDKSLYMVREKFPSNLSLFTRKKDNGRAEALLLSLFGAKSLGFEI